MSDVNPSRYLIYGLLDPRNQCLRYIGKTHKRRELRLTEHIDTAKQGRTAPVYSWIRELLAKRMLPEIFVLERVPRDGDWQEAERRNIKRWRSPESLQLPYHHPPQTKKSEMVVIRSARLTNVHDGGLIPESNPLAEQLDLNLSLSIRD